ncbi:hypothetical protein C2R22_06275 [Salinigranum rubrum]|uniref:Uncharacterized protein n=1 Tax=Salinigranum rubrum TaxID=755307 RepID=A0A2I8VHD3_9EURY|nr:hypothetical protein C2R22_06275 [Salinigranum rubrum]
MNVGWGSRLKSWSRHRSAVALPDDVSCEFESGERVWGRGERVGVEVQYDWTDRADDDPAVHEGGAAPPKRFRRFEPFAHGETRGGPRLRSTAPMHRCGFRALRCAHRTHERCSTATDSTPADGNAVQKPTRG